MLLHLNYPGLFRRIYAEETEGRSGTFSIRRKYDEPDFKNADGFAKVKDVHPGSASFLLEQLFDVEVLELGDGRNIEESVLRSRACFKEILQNLANSLIDAAQSWHAHRHEAKQP